MKSTLIFLLLFCVSYTAFARIDTIYTEQNGVVTMQVLETPDESHVLEEKSFKNTTPYTFTDQEVYTLMGGGAAQKGLVLRMETLFPPRFVEEYDEISLENGATQQDPQTSAPEMSWGYLGVCMMLPVIMILIVNIIVPGDKRKRLVLFYFLLVATAVVVGTIVAAGAASAGEASFVIQYTAFIAVSCLFGYGVRQLWLRRKEKKLVQV